MCWAWCPDSPADRPAWGPTGLGRSAFQGVQDFRDGEDKCGTLSPSPFSSSSSSSSHGAEGTLLGIVKNHQIAQNFLLNC